jgi:hypothetical protein
MPKLQIIGRVIPEYAQLSAPKISVDWGHDGAGVRAKIFVAIEQSKVIIDCDTNKFKTQDEQSVLVIHAHGLARSMIDVFGFQFGMGLDLTFDTITIDSGNPLPLRFPDSKLHALAKVVQSNQNILAIIRLAHHDLKLGMALRHLNEALTAPRRTSVRSAQCVDGIRSLFVPPGGKEKAGWPPLRDNLNISKAYLDVVMDESHGPRHGDYTELVGVNRSDSVFRAWEVMNRYLEFRIRDSGPLPLNEFPLLT